MAGRERRAFLETCDCRMSLFRREWAPQGERMVETFLPAGENLPCAYTPLDHQHTERGEAATLKLCGKVFAPPEIAIEPGMKILLLDGWQERSFITCGLPVVYPSHQEVWVEMEERI